MRQEPVHVNAGPVTLEGNLSHPEGAQGLVIFAHGSGSSRHSPRNRAVAHVLDTAGLATLLIDLLTPEEGVIDDRTARLRFDIELLTQRLIGAADWAAHAAHTSGLRIGLFGASTGAAAALAAAAQRPDLVTAVVSRGGRPDLAADWLDQVRAPTLLIVGGEDHEVIDMNQFALDRLQAEKRMEIVPGATHLFEEPGALDQVAHLARDWFTEHLVPATIQKEERF